MAMTTPTMIWHMGGHGYEFDCTGLEAERDLRTVATFPMPAEILAAVPSLADPARG